MTMNGELVRRLQAMATDVDRVGAWSQAVIDALSEAGCWRWMIPTEFGGAGLEPVDLVVGYETVARGSMAASLIFTQHDAAADLIVRGDNAGLRERLCPKLAAGAYFLTVGISQLTTSRQGGEPAMKVDWDGMRARFDGDMPWSTAPAHCDAIVTGGVCADGQQLIACMPADSPGLTVAEPMALSGLQSTATTAVHCDGVEVGADWVIRGPVEKALGSRSTVRPLVVSASGIGLAGSMVDLLREIAPKRSAELRSFADDIIRHYERVRGEILDAAEMLGQGAGLESRKAEIRSTVNDLVVRLALVLMTLAKGTGYMTDHPAQRFVREAMFFLVWSAPETVQRMTLAKLLGEPETD